MTGNGSRLGDLAAPRTAGPACGASPAPPASSVKFRAGDLSDKPPDHLPLVRLGDLQYRKLVRRQVLLNRPAHQCAQIVRLDCIQFTSRLGPSLFSITASVTMERLLKIACGTGRLLVPFLRDGLAVEGLDGSAEMLAICRSKAAQFRVTPTLYQQLMQDVDLPTRYRTVFIPTCSFQILAERDEAFEALRRFHRHLEPGGKLLITLSVPWRDFGVERQWQLRRLGVRPFDGATILIHEATEPIASNRCSTFGCATRSSKTGYWCRLNCARTGCGGTTDTSCHVAGLRGFPRGDGEVRVPRQRVEKPRDGMGFYR
jgi:SAM-dependent methyltransferase